MDLTLSEQLAYSTVRIECELKTGEISTGTGFFFRFLEDKKKDSFVPVIITNKHVIKNSLKGKLFFTKANEKGERLDTEHHIVVVENLESWFKVHPDEDVDLCAIPFAPFIEEANKKGIDLFYGHFTKDLLINEKHKDELKFIENILMVGYPNDLWDSVNNKPILSKGYTATHPLYDYKGKKEIMINIAAFSGSAGSPVIIFEEGSYSDKKRNNFMGMGRLILLGILYSEPHETTRGDIKITSNFSLVIKSERILELEQLFKKKELLNPV